MSLTLYSKKAFISDNGITSYLKEVFIFPFSLFCDFILFCDGEEQCIPSEASSTISGRVQQFSHF